MLPHKILIGGQLLGLIVHQPLEAIFHHICEKENTR